MGPMIHTLAILSDIHGNRWALEAVLEELEREGLDDAVVDLGDVLFGPLDPAGTMKLLRDRAWPTVRGNQDRLVIEPGAEEYSPTHAFVREQIGEEGVAWLTERTAPPFERDGILACHGTPDEDDACLTEIVEPAGARLRTPVELDLALAGLESPMELVLCGHSHVPRYVVSDRGVRVGNPGSVGLPAYRATEPHPHVMEAGSPDARYALAHRVGDGWRLEHRSVAYDSEAAARAAEENGRPDWAAWIRTGRAAR